MPSRMSPMLIVSAAVIENSTLKWPCNNKPRLENVIRSDNLNIY